MWKLCVVDDESNRTVVKLVRSDYTVGRAEDCTIRLTERNISRAHARIFRNGDDEWRIEDRGSYTGSFVNGEKVEGERSLQHGDTIRLGEYRLELTDDDRAADVDAPGLPQVPSAAELPDRFVVVQGPALGVVHPLTEQKLLVGRGEECQIVLDDASVSRVHVEVLRTEHGLMILDQGSSNGLRINGAELPSAMLRSGDVVELGDVRLKFVPAGVEDVVAQAMPGGVVAEAAQLEAASRRSFMPVYLGVGVALLGLVFFAVRPAEEEPASVTSVRVEAAEPVEEEEPVSGDERLLEDAKEMAARGNVVLAHRKLEEVPPDSPLRDTEDFRAIQQLWADEIFKVASDSPDAAERRSLLDKVAKTPGVDAERRRRAADELSRLAQLEQVQGVDVADLPPAGASRSRTRGSRSRSSATRVARAERSPSAPSASAASEPSSSAAPSPSVPPPPPQTKPTKPPPKAEPRPAPVATSQPSRAVPPKPASEADTDLIRDSPF